MGWISVKDELPEETGRYWCYCQEVTSLGFAYVQWNCAYNKNDNTWSYDYVGTVTHWMPLAEIPE